MAFLLACQQFLLSAQGSEVMAPPAPTPPPGQGAGDSAAAQNATTVAGAGANPADVARARSVLAMVTQPPPPALDPVAASQAAAISQLKAVSTRRDKPHLVILADSAVPADWGEMIQRQAPDLCVTAVSVLGDSLSRLAGAYLSARETHPMPIQELALVVPIGILRAIASMPTASRLEVATRDAAVRSLTTELLSTVHLLVSQPLVPGTGGAEAAPTPRRVSLYVWRADTRQSDLGAASVAVFTSLKKEFPDGSPVRVCTQLDNVPLNQAQQAIAADWDSKLSSMYLHTTEGVEQWTDAALAFFATVVGGSAVHNWRAALRADADASVMKVVGAAVPATSANVENLRRAVHNTNLCKPPRAGWNESFVEPESASCSQPSLSVLGHGHRRAQASSVRKRWFSRLRTSSSSQQSSRERRIRPQVGRLEFSPPWLRTLVSTHTLRCARWPWDICRRCVTSLQSLFRRASTSSTRCSMRSRFPGRVTAAASKAAWPRSLALTWRYLYCCAALLAARKKWGSTLRFFMRYGGSSHRLILHATSTSPMTSRVPSWPTTSTMSTECMRSTLRLWMHNRPFMHAVSRTG